MPTVNIDGILLNYQQANSECADGSILFIHGSGGSIDSWRCQMSNLPPGYTGIAIDLPGHGSSTGQPLRTVEEAALFITRLLQALNLPRPIYLAGHSMGTAISLYTARYYPEYADGLILVGSGAKLRVLPERLESLARGELNPEFTRQAFAANAPAELVEKQIEAAKRNTAELVFTDFSMCDRFDIREEVPNIKQKTLLIVGTEDKLTPVKYAEYLEKNLPDARLKIIENAGHYVMLEQPDEVNRTIREFV